MLAHPKLRNTGNAMIDRIPEEEFEILRPNLQAVKLSLKQVIHPFDINITDIHFPTTAMASLLSVTGHNDPVEVATVGRWGLLGITGAMGVDASPHRVICQMNGESLRLKLPMFREAMTKAPVLAHYVQSFAAFSIYNASKAVACNAWHSVEARTSRWLLMFHDQVGRDEFRMTQEFLAFMLGMRRQTVNGVACTLQNAGLIRYRRGVILIRDRARLEAASCECYASIRDYYRRVVSLDAAR